MRATLAREDALRRRIAGPLAGLGPGVAREHPDPELVVAHAGGDLAGEDALAVGAHLAVCEDGRCRSLVRDAVAGAFVAREALYGRSEERTDSAVASPPQATERAFACPDDLWEAFAALARDEGASIDWLINDAMKAYAQQRSGPVAPVRVTVRDAPDEGVRERNTPTVQRAYVPRARREGAHAARPSRPPTSARRPEAAGALSVVVEGIRYAVNKERFVVGRGGRGSDLAIDDPGVSRQHALIERAGGAYWLVDMGSTNGVEFEGERIARKEIAHGDRFRLGDHEIEFLFG